MSRRVTVLGVALLSAPLVAASQTTPADAIRATFAAVLPFPEANADGLPANGDPGPLWTVRWPAGDELTVEVIANPLNVANQKRAAEAEVEIQNAVKASQQRSQGDYERALAEFARGDRTSPIREVSLFDDGVAGERFDAETRLTIAVDVNPSSLDSDVASSVEPSVTALAPGVLAVSNPSNTYRAPASSDEPARSRFAAAQARVYIGGVSAPVVRRRDDHLFSVTVRPLDAALERPVVVTVTGNGELVQETLSRADWARLRNVGRE
jgi:hypothetical protein